METLKVIIFEYLLGYGLQSFAVIFGMYTFNRQNIILKNYIFVSVFVSIIVYLVRLLPISFGVHIIVNMLVLFLICVILLKMPAYRTIRSASLVVVLILICEMIVTAVLIAIMGKAQFEIYMYNSLHRSFIGVLANVIFSLLITSYYLLMKKGDKHRNISSQVS